MRGTKRFRFIKIPEKILNPERITEKKETVGQKFMQNTGEKIRRRRREKYRNRVSENEPTHETPHVGKSVKIFWGIITPVRITRSRFLWMGSH